MNAESVEMVQVLRAVPVRHQAAHRVHHQAVVRRQVPQAVVREGIAYHRNVSMLRGIAVMSVGNVEKMNVR